MRARPLMLGIAGLAGLAAGVVPALAADQTVSADNFSFTPETVTVEPGDTVTWTKGDGSHNVKFTHEDFATPEEPSSSWPDPVSRSFSTAGEYGYYCEAHGTSAGGGMSGVVVVDGDAADPTPSPSPSPTPSPSPSPGPSPSPSPSPAPTQTTTAPSPTSPADTPPQEEGGAQPVTVAPASSTGFCPRRTRRCRRRPGVVLRVRSDRAQTLRGTLSRRSGSRTRRFGTLRLAVREGTQRIRFLRTSAGRRLLPGRYVLRIRGSAPSDLPITVRFRVLRP